MAEWVELLLGSADSKTITEWFLRALVIVLLLSLYLKNKNRAHQFTQYTPTLLTTLGILGTFVGIVSGLLGFNVEDIDGSIGQLLSGLKTAFITSLAGMLLSIFYKVLVASGLLSLRHKNEIDEDAIGIAELYGVMKEQADLSHPLI